MTKLRIAVFLAFAVLASGAWAQPAADAPPPLWSGKADLSYAATSGNTSTSSFGTGLEVTYRPAPWKVEAKFALLRASSDGVVTAEAYSGGLKGSRELTKTIEAFAGAAYYRNTFSGIDRRLEFDAGAGYKLLDGPAVFLRPDLSFGYQTETQTAGVHQSFPMGRAGLKFVWKFAKGAEFANEFSYTDNLSTTDDWIIKNAASISASLTSVFALKFGWAIIYDNVPVPGFRKRDSATSAALVAKF